jgi:hypothetical protein
MFRPPEEGYQTSGHVEGVRDTWSSCPLENSWYVADDLELWIARPMEDRSTPPLVDVVVGSPVHTLSPAGCLYEA